jgi:eukaryotic-like serine/threonine-protein kinase
VNNERSVAGGSSIVQLVENAVVAGRFKLERLLGRGGMGSVWQAQHLGLDIPCAVKFIEGEFATMQEAHVRFEREAKAAAQLRSPHVVQILDHGLWEGRPYIAMELLEGEDLGKRIQRAGRLHPAELNTVLAQVCRALGKAHTLGIVHRDLKPDNIFLVRDDDREIAKVLDFGIAKSKSSDLVTGSNTRTGAMLGTPYYMSPEQAQGTKAVDSRSDLWSLAVIAYQCITGRLPFESEALGDLLIKIIVSPIPVPSQVAHVPPGFDAWFARAASRDPSHRFQTAKEFSDSLALAVGSSALTDVMDHRALQAALAQQRAGSHAAAQTYPHPTGSPMGQYPYPPPQQQPRPFEMTPASAMAQSIATNPAFQTPVTATTGAPIARTYSGMAENAVVPRKSPSKLPVLLAAAGLTIVLGGIGLFGAVKYLRKGSPSAAGGAETTAIATAALPTAAPPTAALPSAGAPATPGATPGLIAATAAAPQTSTSASASAANMIAVGTKSETKPTETHRVHTGQTATNQAGTTGQTASKPHTGGQAAAVEKMGF